MTLRVKVTEFSQGGFSGTAKSGDVIEAINLSTAPAGRLHLTDTVVVGKANEQGKFTADFGDLREGDLVRLRARNTDGPSDWLTVQVNGVGAHDTHNAFVNLERIDLALNDAGGINLVHNTPRPISEPFATLRFVNQRTQQITDISLTSDGSFPAGSQLPGKKGDDFTIAVSDGTNNANFSTTAGTLRAGNIAPPSLLLDFKDPAPLARDRNPDGTSKYALVRFTGALIIDGIRPEDVRQGAIGNCYLPAAVAAIAKMDNSLLKDTVRQLDDGSYVATFYERRGRRFEKVEIKDLDGDLYAYASGSPVYDTSLGSGTKSDDMELLYPMLGKAYAKWKGSYEAVGNGGVSGATMSELTGRHYDYFQVSHSSKQQLWNYLVAATNNKQPMTAGTYGTSEAARYTNTGIYAHHAYSVYGGEEDGGKRFVRLRNPWGQSEPVGDGINDGIFRLDFDVFTKLFSNLSILRMA